jgi:hypothetical protein
VGWRNGTNGRAPAYLLNMKSSIQTPVPQKKKKRKKLKCNTEKPHVPITQLLPGVTSFLNIARHKHQEMGIGTIQLAKYRPY